MDDIKWLFFDLGHTLVNEDSAQKDRINRAVDILNSKGVKVNFKQFYQRACQASVEYKSPFITALRYYSSDCDIFIPYHSDLEVLYEDTAGVIETLSKKYSLAVIANQAIGTETRLKKFGIYDYFRFVLSSSEVGLSKPDPRFFIYALEKAKCNPAKSVMIGDRLDNDIKPAKSLKMNTIWVKQGYGGKQKPIGSDYFPDVEVGNLSEILDVL